MIFLRRLIIFMFILLVISPYVFCEDHYISTEGFLFPESLKIIESSAFEGTNPVIIKLFNNVVLIGDKAFSNIGRLKAIYIPDSVVYIGENATDGNVFLVGTEDSIGHKWAKTNNNHFTVYPSLKENKQQTVAICSINRKTKISKHYISYRVEDNQKQLPGLTIGELILIRLTRDTDFRIDGRAPPHVFVALITQKNMRGIIYEKNT